MSAPLPPLQTYSLPTHRTLPAVPLIRAIHVYDFDNTLFLSPLPNPKLWHGPTLNNLQSPTWLSNGGWWHDSRILAATGDGVEIEEKKGWEGWWNENIVELVKLSMLQKDAMTVLLTGRSGEGFGELVSRMCASRGLVFDMVVMKPDGSRTTVEFKREFLGRLLDKYEGADEIKIYEDRLKHVRAFTDFLSAYPSSSSPPHRRPLTSASVIEVSEESRCLPPSTELREIQSMISLHNSQRPPSTPPLKIKKTVFYTGYLLANKATALVLNKLGIPGKVAVAGNGGGDGVGEVKLLGNSVLITPKPATRTVLRKTGEMGTRVEFEVASTGCWEGKVWAACVRPVNPKIRIYTDNPKPLLVLAVKRGAKPIDASRIMQWTPHPPGVRFWTVVGEKVLLRIEEEFQNEGEWESLFPRRGRGKEMERMQQQQQQQQQVQQQGGGIGGHGFNGGYGAVGLGMGRGQPAVGDVVLSYGDPVVPTGPAATGGGGGRPVPPMMGGRLDYGYNY